MYCENCGTKVDDNDTYCPNCGDIISANYKAPNSELKFAIGIFVLLGAVVIIFGIIFGVYNYITAKKQAPDTYSASQDTQDTNAEYPEKYVDFDIHTATEDKTADTNSAETTSLQQILEGIVEDEDSFDDMGEAALQRVYDFAGVLNKEDKKQLELEYSKVSENWNCNFAIFFMDIVNDETEVEIFEVLEQSNNNWNRSIPNIVFVYEVMKNEMYAYSSNGSGEMFGDYSQEYCSYVTMMYYVPEDSSDFYNRGAIMLNPFVEIHEKFDSTYTLCEEDLQQLEKICKKSIAFSEYRLMLEGSIQTIVLGNQEIKAFGLIDMNEDGLDELIVDAGDNEETKYYILQWEDYGFDSWQKVPSETSKLYVKEDNTLLAYWLVDDTAYPYHYVLTEFGLEVREDEPEIYFGKENPYDVISYELLDMLDNTEDNRNNYLTTDLQYY